MACQKWLFETGIEMTSFRDIERLVVEAGRKGGLPDSYLRIAHASAEDGTPHIEVDGDSFAYVVSERGSELSRQKVTSLDDLLFLILSDIAEKYAFAKECTQRTPGEDPRRAAFGMWLACIKSMNPEWGAKITHELDTILTHAPYVDR